jgi:iron complex transport system substrate-binding protein
MTKAALFVLYALLVSASVVRAEQPASSSVGELRIVSLAPSLTEIVYALGAQENLVAVTRFCDYPPEAKEHRQVGGYVDLNYEAILSSTPTLVLLLGEHAGAKSRLNALNLQTLSLGNESLEVIFTSIVKVGVAVNRQENASSLVSQLRQRVASVRSHALGLSTHPKVLVTIGGNANRRGLEKVVVAGRGTIFSELIEVAGGINAYTGSLKYPGLSAEGIMSINPDVIIDVIPNTSQKDVPVEEILKMWQSLPYVSAVLNERIHIITEEFAVNPGPRIVNTLELFARLIQQ